MMRTVLILAAVAVALLAVLALTRGGPRRGAVEVASPAPAQVEAPATSVPTDWPAPKVAVAAPVEPEASGVDDDAAATGMTTRDAAPADQAAEAPVEKKEP